MRLTLHTRSFALILVGFLLSACGQPENKTTPLTEKAVKDAAPEQNAKLTEAHYRGLGHMERYEYTKAVADFRAVLALAPTWNPGAINLAIALLNDTGAQKEDAKKNRKGEPLTNFDEALELLTDVITRDPSNINAYYCRGIILGYQGRLAEAHKDFLFVASKDPHDGHVWFQVGSTMTDPDDPERQAGVKQAKELVATYTKALECNPYLTTAMYKLQAATSWTGDRQSQDKLLELWKRFNKKQPGNAAGPGDTAELFYGEAGKYAKVINPFPSLVKPANDPVQVPRFDGFAPLKVTLEPGVRWVKEADFTDTYAVIGRARARYAAAIASFDADGDGKLDLYLTAAVVGPQGIRDILLVNKGNGVFQDATAAFGLPLDRAGLGVAAGDFDADRRIDLYVTGVGDNRLYRNLGGKFQLVDLPKPETPSVSLTARWMDLDQDGDLDLYVLNYAKVGDKDTCFIPGAKAPQGVANLAYRNDGKAGPIAQKQPDNWVPLGAAPSDYAATEGLSIALVPWTGALVDHVGPHSAVAALDIDEDRDIDLVITADGSKPIVILNDRLGQFHQNVLEDVRPDGSISGLLVADFDKDGRPDLGIVSDGGRVQALRNETTHERDGVKFAWKDYPIAATKWRTAETVDLDLDTWPDLVGLPLLSATPALNFQRNSGTQFADVLLGLAPDSLKGEPAQGMALVDLAGDPLPDLLVLRDGQGPQLAVNRGNGRHWLAIELNGRWKTDFDHMRSNPQGLGVRLALEGQGLNVPYDYTTPIASLAQSVAPIVLGMGTSTTAPLLRLRWPDGVMQCELNVTADQTLRLAEVSRKTGSCPVLFTWNGERFECLGDFLGGGGMGYLVAPGTYGQPDRDESVGIRPHQLKPVNGTYRLSITEPMDEVAYLDHLVLTVVDRPPGVDSTPDERFAPEGLRPTGKTVAWSKSITPIKATDQSGTDVTSILASWDRKTVDTFRRLKGWIGYAEEHGITLDFGDRLSGFTPTDPLTLCLAGWVEYPYSQTNYAASTAGVELKTPVIERLQADGTWTVIEPNPGYPAGLPRMTTLDLTGKLTGPSCVIRIKTNMECYYDQAFIALRGPASMVRETDLTVTRAELQYKGYFREVSPDGKLPLLYDHDYVDPAPLARLGGVLTRLGDVTSLLQADDDQHCLVGPGDEVRIEFEDKGLPPLPEGWTRAFMVKSVGYCKDADPFTAGSDNVGPLPWKGMPAFPFGREGERPLDPDYERYLKTYQTRPAGSR